MYFLQQSMFKNLSKLLFRHEGIKEGCDLRLRLLFPAAAPQVLFQEHAEHLAFESTSFIDTAVAWNQKQSSV